MNQILTMSIKDAAAQLGLTHWTLRKYVRQGRLPAVRIGRRLLIEPAALQRLITNGRTEAQNDL
jgi:excisionase family DNA binding protein